MKILSYGCKNYKPFDNEIVIEVKPLTLIFGKNSSGKSASLRLLRLISQALTTTPGNKYSFPLDVENINFGNSFSDLVHNRLPHGSITLSAKIENDGEIIDFTTTIQNISVINSENNEEVEYPIVSNFTLKEPLNFNLIWEPSHVKIAKYQNVGHVSFGGLLPESKGALSQNQWDALSKWQYKLNSFKNIIFHLGPFRKPIEKIYASRSMQPLGFSGSEAPNILAKDPELMKKVSSWYKENMDGWSLSIDPSGIAFQCVLGRGKAKINLADAGQGMQQVLPIVVQQMQQQLKNEDFIHLIEQPELHLHTAAQAPLGDLFLNTAKTGKGNLIIETHSENILLRIRRRIAEGEDPNLVAVYWVQDHPEGNSTIRRINIDQSGKLDWWEDGVFSEGYEEVRAIARAARNPKIDK